MNAGAAPRTCFVVGCGRSGTTVLSRLVGVHEDARVIIDDFALWCRAFPEADIWGRLPESGVTSRVALDARDAGVAEEGSRRRFLGALEAARAGRRLLVEKLAINAFRMGFVHALVPDARFILIVRDGREVARSIAERISAGRWLGAGEVKWSRLVEHAAGRGLAHLPLLCRSQVEMGLLEWRLSVEASLRFVRAHPSCPVLVVRYERLTRDAPTVARELREFLGLPASASMERFARDEIRPPRARPGEPIGALEPLAGEVLRSLGYMDPWPDPVEIDYFAYPRSGSHYFRLCAAGLFDGVSLPDDGSDEPEVIARRDELRPEALAALLLRDHAGPPQPVRIRADALGRHALPAPTRRKAIVLLRDPAATAYSLWRLERDRHGRAVGASRLRRWLADIRRFHAAAEDLARADPARVLLLRYEDLRRDSGALRRLVQFVGAAPKLDADRVFDLVRFEALVRLGARTFYREGRDEAWRDDPAFVRALADARAGAHAGTIGPAA